MSDAEPSALCMQVTHTYSVALDRSDHCLLMYGFVDDSPEPLLAAVDHIGGIIMEDEDDSMYGGAPLFFSGIHPQRLDRDWRGARSTNCLLHMLACCSPCAGNSNCHISLEPAYPAVALVLHCKTACAHDQARKTGGCHRKLRSRG